MTEKEVNAQRILALEKWINDNPQEKYYTKDILIKCFNTEVTRGKCAVIGKMMNKLGFFRIKPEWPQMPYYKREVWGGKNNP